MSEVQEFWEQRYGERERIWSGRVNQRMAEVVDALPAGRALDLGCGEGADAMWLAERGWQVTAVDISETALRRGRDDAQAKGLLDRIDFVHHDLSESFPPGSFDLVSAQFLQSPVHLDRDTVLRRAAAAVVPGGLLLIIEHGAPPAWAPPDVHEHHFPTAQEVVASLQLDSVQWQQIRAEAVERQATGPDGQVGALIDNVIVLHRGKPARG